MSCVDVLAAAKEASKAEAHLYVWGCVLELLTGSTSPDRAGHKGAAAVARVVKIAQAESSRLLREHDAALARLNGAQS